MKKCLDCDRLMDQVHYCVNCGDQVLFECECNQIRVELERLSAQNVLLLGQRERAMQAAKWLSAFRDDAPQYKAAISELTVLEKEVQG